VLSLFAIFTVIHGVCNRSGVLLDPLQALEPLGWHLVCRPAVMAKPALPPAAMASAFYDGVLLVAAYRAVQVVSTPLNNWCQSSKVASCHRV
jgi:hypothetical protein